MSGDRDVPPAEDGLQPCDEQHATSYVSGARPKPWPASWYVAGFSVLSQHLAGLSGQRRGGGGSLQTATSAGIHSCIWISITAQFAPINKAGGEKVKIPFL